MWPEEKSNRVFFSHTNDRDLVYEGLNIKQALAYLETKKKKRKQSNNAWVLSSVSEIKKITMPSNGVHYVLVGICQLHTTREWIQKHKNAKKERRTDEQETDPASLFLLICKWAVREGNVFVWVFSLLMWNLMSRSINVDSVSFHMFKSGTSDSIKAKFDKRRISLGSSGSDWITFNATCLDGLSLGLASIHVRKVSRSSIQFYPIAKQSNSYPRTEKQSSHARAKQACPDSNWCAASSSACKKAQTSQRQV